MKHNILGILLFATLFARGAADDGPLTVEKLVGMACSSRGNYKYTTSLSTEDNDPCFSLTVVYSEHSILKESDRLDSFLKTINEHIDQQKKYINPYELAKIRIKNVLEHPDDQDVTHSGSLHESCSLLALVIRLNKAKVEYAFTRQSHDARGSYKPQKGTISIVSCGKHATPSNSPAEDAQAKAAQLQLENPKEPLHVIINLEKWHQFIASRNNPQTSSVL
jgi:hypothetical protein